LWKFVSGERPRPEPSEIVAPSTSTTRRSAGASSSTSNTIGRDSDELEAWITGARKASITIELAISKELRHIAKRIPKEDPAGLWKHLEKRFQPETAIEAARLYRQLLEITQEDGETAEDTIDRADKAISDILDSMEEIKPYELLGAFILSVLTPKNENLVNLVYSTQNSSKPLTFEEASASIW